MRAIDADHLRRWVLSRVVKTQLSVADVVDQIDREDTIEPERKTGRWIFVHPFQDNDPGAYMCSVCKTGDWDIKPIDKYCKFCGAQMEEGD